MQETRSESVNNLANQVGAVGTSAFAFSEFSRRTSFASYEPTIYATAPGCHAVP